MKRTITFFIFILISLSSFGQQRHSEVIVSGADSTAVQKKVAELRDSLNNRNFSEDVAKIKEKAEQLGNKTKEVVTEHTPVIEQLVKSFVDYLKR